MFRIFILARLRSHNLFKSLSSPLPGTNQYLCHMRSDGRDQCGVRNHDLEDARQTPYPLDHRSPSVVVVEVVV